MTVCAEGHYSANGDFCDVCGTRIGGDPGSSPGRTIGRHHGPGPGVTHGDQTCPGCGAPVFGQFCDACGFSPRTSTPFAPLDRPAESFSSAPAGLGGPPSPSWVPVSPSEAFPGAGSSSGPPESLFPPISRPEPLSSPRGRMEPPPSSWSHPEPAPSSWSPSEPPGTLGGRSRLPTSPPDPPARPDEPGSPAESGVTDLLASLFSSAPPAPPASPAPPAPPPVRSESAFSFLAPVEPAPSPKVRPEPTPAPGVRVEPAPAVVSKPPASTARPASSAPPTAPTPSFTPATWTVLIASDRAYYDRMKVVRGMSGSDVAFPAHTSERRIPLIGKQMRIGRRSAARELEPEIDLADPPVDPGISRLHAMLIASPDGTWSILDPGSANGTLLNGREIATGDLITLREGDRINLGAWTVISVHRG